MFNNSLIQLLVLAGIAVFLILRLRGVLGTRDGFEPSRPVEPPASRRFEVIEGTATEGDSDISDHAEPGTPIAAALTDMKRAEPDFAVGLFLSGARQAYEMILTAFERGDIDEVRPFLAPPVAEALQSAIDGRRERGETVDVQFLGTRETALSSASFDGDSREAEISVRFVGETITAVKNAEGEIIDGDAKAPRKQRDTWTFARTMGADDPNWKLVATG